MSEVMPERRDIQSVLSDIRVDVGQIKVRQEEQGKTLVGMAQKLDLGVFREEYERRHKDMEAEIQKSVKEATTARDETIRQQGGQRVWRIVYTTSLAILGFIEVYVQHH